MGTGRHVNGLRACRDFDVMLYLVALKRDYHRDTTPFKSSKVLTVEVVRSCVFTLRVF